MNPNLCFILLALTATFTAPAAEPQAATQPQATTAPPARRPQFSAPAVSPDVQADRRVTFRLSAPKAADVVVAGQWANGRAAIELDSRQDEPHYFLGLALRQQNKPVEAEAEFERALQINPKQFKAHGNLGVLFAERGNLDAAEAHFQSALQINPNDSFAREWLGTLSKAKAGLRNPNPKTNAPQPK